MSPRADSSSLSPAVVASSTIGSSSESAPLSSAAVSSAPPSAESASHTFEGRRERVHQVFGRVVYWAPVFVALVLFAQVSFLGLRPAMSEAGRLNAAEGVLEARHDQAVTLNQRLTAHLAAREDPIYLERQRRQRAWTTTPSVAPAVPAADVGE